MSKNSLVLFLLILFICYDELMAVDSPCGDWMSFKEEKCFKIMDKAGLQTYDEAEKTCQQQETSSTLISIGSQEEHEFISNFIKTNKISNDLWIGMKYTNNRYKWSDNSDLVFSNWEIGSPKNKTDHCVQLLCDENTFGKWSDVLCNRKNIVVCQKMQTWSLFHMQKLLLNTIKNPFPIGFIYVQLPNEKSPKEIWSWMLWNDVSSDYAGIFFRVNGGNASPFGQIQSDNAPRLTDVKQISDNRLCTNDNIQTKLGSWSDWVKTGGFDEPWVCQSFEMSSGEVRPQNMAMPVWKRTG